MTVPSRYLELGQMREALNISGKFCEATMAARHVYLKRFFPDIEDGNWQARSKQMVSQPIFAEFTKSRRLLDLGNVMRTMNRPDQDRFKLQMFCVLATG